MTPQEKAEQFLSTGAKFRLGELTTEKNNPLTQGLSELVKKDVPASVQLLKKVDLLALEAMKSSLPELVAMKESIAQTLNDGNRVFLCGCGATGRLSLTIEALWRKDHPDSDQVRAFMAGGDIALVHAVEGFEDFPEYGEKQLIDRGFTENDLLISCTEGGETPFVIGATWFAANTSQRKPFFLYCNQSQLLMQKVERSREVLESEKINSIEIFVGSMAVAGSTRMQASTVLQLALGLCFFEKNIEEAFHNFYLLLKEFNFEKLSDFIVDESGAYQNNEFVHYFVDDFAITVFTDTTERAPTFSLQPFNHLKKELPQSLAFLSILKTKSPLEAWESILQRKPGALGWDNSKHLKMDYLEGFDFSEKGFSARKSVLDGLINEFTIDSSGGEIHWLYKEHDWRFDLSKWHPLYRHMLIKLLLNTHSTLVMGRMDRYKSNMMTWVYPSNGKLIDRATRYVQTLAAEEGLQVNYEDIVHALFEEMEALSADQSVVLNTLKRMKRAR